MRASWRSIALAADDEAAAANRNRAPTPEQHRAGMPRCVHAFEHNGVDIQVGELFLRNHDAVLSAPSNFEPE